MHDLSKYLSLFNSPCHSPTMLEICSQHHMGTALDSQNTKTSWNTCQMNATGERL